MIEIRTARAIDQPWLSMESLRLGTVPSGLPTPNEYVVVSKNGKPWLRIDLYGVPDEHRIRDEILEWHGWLVIGTGERVHMIDTESSEIRKHHLDSGFSSFWVDSKFLLAVSRATVTKISATGDVLWSSRPDGSGGGLGIDSVEDGTIGGEVEWELGDWRPFQIDLESGSAR